MLHFTNGNEEAIASYAIEAERAGSWERVASFVPGEGRYSLEAQGNATYRLVTERVDGTTALIAF